METERKQLGLFEYSPSHLQLGEKRWDHSGIEVVHLRAAEKAVSDFPYVTEKGEAMLTQSKLSGLLRETLKK